MGRLPKGFKKSAGKHPEPEDAAAPEQEPAKEEHHAKPAPAPAPAPSKAAAKATEEQPAHSGSEDESDDDGEKGPETRGKMLQRHKKVGAAGPYATALQGDVRVQAPTHPALILYGACHV